MNGSPILDVAIGLILMYLLLSILCTTINEYIATIARLRARTLRGALAYLIDVPVLKTNFYDHGLISSAISKRGAQPSYLSGQTFALAILGSLDPTKPMPLFSDVENAVKALPDSNIRDTLLMHIALAGQDLGKLRSNIADWFDSAMDRVSGVYKRMLKWISLAVGLILAVALYANTVVVAETLWANTPLRQQLVSLAGETVSNGAPASQNSTDLSNLNKQIDTTTAKLQVFPIGWQTFQSPKSYDDWLTVIAGLLLTGVALSFGAPFWFDLLSKFVNVRGAGIKPARSSDSDDS